MFHQYRATAEQLTERIAGDIHRLIEVEEQRSFSEYSYFAASRDGAVNYVQQSPLAAFPVVENTPGVVGYFQVDSQGRLSSPVAPELGVNYVEHGISEGECLERIGLHKHLREIMNTPELDPTNRKPSRPAQVEKLKPADDKVLSEAFSRPAELKSENVFDRLSKSFENSRQKIRADYASDDELELDSRRDAKSRA